MKKISKLLLSISIILISLIICSFPCMAKTKECIITVALEDNKKNPLDNIEVFICKIADAQGSDYYPASGFENSGISISKVANDPSALNALNILDFVKKNKIDSLKSVSVLGKAEFTALDSGIWLVYCDDEGEYSFNPYFVFLPLVVDGELLYNISSAPKVEYNTPNSRSIYVLKKWEDKNNAAKKRPQSVTVELLRNGKVVDTALLNEKNGWAHTFRELPKKGKYSISEKSVEHYSAKYSGDSENGFIITNSYSDEKLPQTGQLWWPVMIVSVAGIGFILLGIIEIRGKKNENK